jgi:hypothetical protein
VSPSASQRVGVNGSAGAKPNCRPAWPAVDPELVARVRADDRQAQRSRASVPVPPAWSMWAWVSQICSSVEPEFVHRRQQARQVAPGVDDRGLARALAEQHRRVLLEGGDRDGAVVQGHR